MSGSFENLDITTIIILVIAVVIFLRLRSVLGRRTGHERPPIDHRVGRSEEQHSYEQDNVVHLPGRMENETTQPKKDPGEIIQERIKDFAPEGSELEASLKDLIKQDPDFDPKTFVEGAKAAYEMIVMAFNEGDRKALKPLLSSEVYESFEDAITSREDNEYVMEVSFIGINKAVLLDCEREGSEASVTVKFVSNIISATRNSDGELVEGDPKKIIEVTDIWTFARKVTSRDPNWKLVGTKSAN